MRAEVAALFAPIFPTRVTACGSAGRLRYLPSAVLTQFSVLSFPSVSSQSKSPRKPGWVSEGRRPRKKSERDTSAKTVCQKTGSGNLPRYFCAFANRSCESTFTLGWSAGVSSLYQSIKSAGVRGGDDDGGRGDVVDISEGGLSLGLTLGFKDGSGEIAISPFWRWISPFLLRETV